MKPTDSRSVYRMARILDIVMDEDIDTKALAGRLCMSRPQSIADYLAYLRRQRKIHICGWTPRAANGIAWPIHRFGQGKNVPRPKAPSHAEYQRAWRHAKGINKPRVAPDPKPVAQPFDQLFK